MFLGHQNQHIRMISVWSCDTRTAANHSVHATIRRYH